MKAYRYLCTFRIDERHLISYIDSISDAREGFWLNKDFHFTRLSDRVYWVPPSAVDHVKKEEIIK